MRFLFLDVETTGKDFMLNDVIEIAGIMVKDGIEINRFSINSRPFSPENIQEEALQVNGYTRKQIDEFLAPSKALKEFEKQISVKWGGVDDRYHIVAHNSSFDKKFLETWLIKGGRYDITRFIDLKYDIDTLAMAKILRANGIIDCAYMNLGSLCRYYKIEYKDKHKALSDVDVLYKLYSCLKKDMKRCFFEDFTQAELF